MAYDLPALIRSIPDFSAKTPQECRDYLSTETTTLKTAMYNANDLMIALTVPVANGLASALESAGLKLVVASLASSNGIDFGHQVTQDMLDTLGQNPAFAPYVASLKALGQDTRTRWQREGVAESLPDLAEFEAAHADALLVSQKLSANEALRTLLESINARINAGTLTANQIAAITLPE